jgi:hypothetical protein
MWISVHIRKLEGQRSTFFCPWALLPCEAMCWSPLEDTAARCHLGNREQS